MLLTLDTRERVEWQKGTGQEGTGQITGRKRHEKKNLLRLLSEAKGTISEKKWGHGRGAALPPDLHKRIGAQPSKHLSPKY